MAVQQGAIAVVSETIPVTLEAAEKLPMRSRRPAWPASSLVELAEVDVAVGVLADHHHIGDRLPPGQLVGVVLVRPDEHHRPLPRRDPVRQPVAVVQVGRDAQVEDADELVDGGGAARPAEQDHGVVVAADGVADDPPRVLAEPGRLQAGARALGVGVGVAGQDLVADEVLDEGQGPARGGVVGVDDPPRAVRPVHHLPVTDDRCPDPLDQRRRCRLLRVQAHPLSP